MTQSSTVRDALREYFVAQGLPANGGVDLAWIAFRVGPLPLRFPNFSARRDAVRYHDVHHLLTGYQTDWPGEAEISAWEVGGGCGRYWVAWLLDSGAMGFGAVCWPRRTWRAWLRGRRSGTLYREAYEPLLDECVVDLQQRLRLGEDGGSSTIVDVAGYILWSAIGLTWMIFAPLAVIVWGVSLAFAAGP